jgi:ribosomal protein S18 acetylase RimI-like enzyme
LHRLDWPLICPWRNFEQLANEGMHMPKSCFMLEVRLLSADQWPEFRDIRLAALKDTPESFLSRYEDETDFGEARWRAEFDRGDWHIGFELECPVSLLGCTREETTPSSECYLEFLWVSPECRYRGIGHSMVTAAIERLRAQGVRTIFLWVLNGNDSAVRLYSRIGFVSGNHRQPLPGRPGRTEELMRLDLD